MIKEPGGAEGMESEVLAALLSSVWSSSILLLMYFPHTLQEQLSEYDDEPGGREGVDPEALAAHTSSPSSLNVPLLIGPSSTL